MGTEERFNVFLPMNTKNFKPLENKQVFKWKSAPTLELTIVAEQNNEWGNI